LGRLAAVAAGDNGGFCLLNCWIYDTCELEYMQ